MPNFWRFNQTLFNGWAQWQWTWLWQDIVIFNWFWLLNSNYITTKLNVWNMPQINLIEVSNPKSDWATLLDRFYKQRTIHIEWHIIWESYEDEQEKIDALKKILAVKQWYFEFKFGDTYRRILATLTNQDIITREHYDIDHAQFSLTFRAETPFWSEKTRQNELYENVNDEINEDIYNFWSEHSNPIINIVMTSVSNTNLLTVWIWDNIITLDWWTTTTFDSVSYWWESVEMTAWPDNTRSWIRPSTWTSIVVSLNSWVPTCVIGWNQIVQMTESSTEWTRTWITQWWVWIIVVLDITRSWEFENWDIIDINTENKTIMVNWNAVDFSWTFPILQAWWNTLNVKANWVYEFDISVLYKKNFL